jgi:hypothetical protein
MPGDPPRRLGRPPKLLTSAGGGLSPKPIHGGTKRVQGSPVARGLGGFGGFAVGDAVETLCEDSGLRGCWFRGQVIAVAAPRRLKIRWVSDSFWRFCQSWVGFELFWSLSPYMLGILDKDRVAASARLGNSCYSCLPWPKLAILFSRMGGCK